MARKRCTTKRARKGLCHKKSSKSRRVGTRRCRHHSGPKKGKFKKCGR